MKFFKKTQQSLFCAAVCALLAACDSNPPNTSTNDGPLLIDAGNADILEQIDITVDTIPSITMRDGAKDTVETDLAIYDISSPDILQADILQPDAPISDPTVWITPFGSTNQDRPLAIAVDHAGNAYATGWFHGQTLIGTITLTASTTSGIQNVFVAKFSPNGQALWAKSFDASESLGIAIDSTKNVYLTGDYAYKAVFGTTTLSSSSVLDDNLFVAKYSPSGQPLWALSHDGGSNNDDSGHDIAIDSSGDAYIAGFTTKQNYHDVLLTKVSKNGQFDWANTITAPSLEEANGIALDSNNNVYLTGRFQTQIVFGTTTLTINTSGTTTYNEEIFIAKFSPTGQPSWAVSAGGTDSDFGEKVAVDPTGNVYVTGWFKSKDAVFATTTITAQSWSDIFVAKYSTTGQFGWVVGGIGSGSATNFAKDIAVDSLGNSYVTGYFENKMYFGSSTISSRGSADIFVAKVSPSGQPLWTMSAGGGWADWGIGIAHQTNTDIYVTGLFGGQPTFGTTTLSSSSFDGFVWKLTAP